MKTIELPLPEIAAIGGTRAALGAGIALLLCDHLDRHERRQLGTLLTAIGLLTTIPLLYDVLIRRQKPAQVSSEMV